MDMWLGHSKSTHLYHPDLALLPLAHDVNISKEAFNLGGIHQNGKQTIVNAHDKARGVQETLKETTEREKKGKGPCRKEARQ